MAKPRGQTLYYAGLTLLLLLLGLAALIGESINDSRYLTARRAEVQNQLAQRRAQLEYQLNGDIQLVKGLISVITLDPQLNQIKFEKAVEPLFANHTLLRNIGAAPDMVIRLMYPIEGNEKAIGLDYRLQPSQLPAVERARETHQIVLAGPVNLVQGGRGVIARMPVFTPGERGTEHFWGIVSAVIDADRLLSSAGLDPNDPNLEIAIRGKDGKGKDGEVFFGQADVFKQEPVTAEILLPLGSWQLAAIPRGGWPKAADNAWLIRLGFLVVASFLLAIFFLLSRALHQSARARQQENATRQQLAASLENTPNVAVQWFTPEGRVIYWNKASERIYGWSSGEALGKTLGELIYSPAEHEHFQQLLAHVVATRETFGPFESLIRDRAGEQRWIEATVFAIPNTESGIPICVCMDIDITDRKRGQEALAEHRDRLESLVEARTRELNQAKEQAETANRAKSIFLANMSHELRTPMNGILGMIELAKRKHSESERLAQMEKAKESGRRLLGVLNDILDLSKIEAERLKLECIPLKLETVTTNLEALLAHRAAEKGLQLRIELPSELAQRGLLGDPLRLGQILINLVGNAIKFSDHGDIVLRVRREPGTAPNFALRFEVEDKGIGISTEDQERLFTAFEQADGSTTRKYGGTGLGLAICKHLVHLMGGEIGIRSSPGAGSTFWFTANLAEDPDWLAPQGNAPATESAESVLMRNYAGTEVLIAEDEPVSQEILRALLEDLGFIVDAANDGRQALSLAQQKTYALILIDMQMPNMNGLDASRAIRQASMNQATPILAVTANAFEHDRLACLEAGMNHFVPKPLDPDRLFASLLDGLRSKQPH